MQLFKTMSIIVLSVFVLMNCTTAPKEDVPAKVIGTITYMQRIVLPPEAVVRIRLEDISKQDIIAERIGAQIIENPGQVPIPFEIEYDPAIIDPRHFYAIQARITVDDELWFINTSMYYVITQDNPSTNVDVVVDLVK